jgi:hypothetical protein
MEPQVSPCQHDILLILANSQRMPPTVLSSDAIDANDAAMNQLQYTIQFRLTARVSSDMFFMYTFRNPVLKNKTVTFGWI